MSVEEEYPDVLQNIESAIVSVFRQEPLLLDFDVENAVSALIAHYQAQTLNREPRRPNLNERARRVYDAARAMCDWRLGYSTLESADRAPDGARSEPVSLDVMIACLKRIRKSVQRWNKEGGRQGYLTFVQQFIP